MKLENDIIRKSFGLKDEIEPQLHDSYHSDLIDRIKESGFTHQEGRLTIRLAEEFGFCYGVDRAIDYAYQTRAKFPGRRIFLTNEMIHNQRVNSKLKEMGIRIFSGTYEDPSVLDDVQKEDVVIIPAFGTPLAELEKLQKKGCVLVDTTCGSVMSVWKRVESYARDGFTSIIHGKYDHEETLATSSRAIRYPRGRFLIVRDKPETQRVCDFIEGRLDKETFLMEFKSVASEGFDPDLDLGHIGCANQTTMLSSESLEIANMLQESMRRKYGEAEIQERFRHFDTICSATQDRQDAVMKLNQEGVDLMIVVGGYNSSNTGHLAEMTEAYCPAFHVKEASCLISKDEIQHKKTHSAEIVQTKNWLPEGNIKVGVTAGASTPNRLIEEVIQRLLELTR